MADRNVSIWKKNHISVTLKPYLKKIKGFNRGNS